jgi:hypothetical protein
MEAPWITAVKQAVQDGYQHQCGLVKIDLDAHYARKGVASSFPVHHSQGQLFRHSLIWQGSIAGWPCASGCPFETPSRGRSFLVMVTYLTHLRLAPGATEERIHNEQAPSHAFRNMGG